MRPIDWIGEHGIGEVQESFLSGSVPVNAPNKAMHLASCGCQHVGLFAIATRIYVFLVFESSGSRTGPLGSTSVSQLLVGTAIVLDFMRALGTLVSPYSGGISNY